MGYRRAAEARTMRVVWTNDCGQTFYESGLTFGEATRRDQALRERGCESRVESMVPPQFYIQSQSSYRKRRW